VHAEAWLRRICRTGGGDLGVLQRRIGEMWAEASRWPGPAGHPGYQAAVAQGMVSSGPEAVRSSVRDWLLALLATEGAEVQLAQPSDWSSWDPEHRR
jgi:ring-1,2-phenylacetyl-CoA epoxidase subunit PaaA/ring-1,2-phenylacetyl-CoA epoxidase subunit PaaC